MTQALHQAIADYLHALHANRATGATVAETTHYPALQKLLDAVGATLKPGVRCITGLSNQGAGMPDGGLFSASQFEKGEGMPINPQQPERGVIEAKGVAVDVRRIARTEQVHKYWTRYRQVLVTSFREFLLVGEIDDRQTVLESFSFAHTEDEFWRLAARPQTLAVETANQCIEFIKRVMLSRAKVAAPDQVAWFLASYARDARSRLEAAGEFPALVRIREGFEAGLGIKFDPMKGDHFFRSTLVQTLFYGIFSAWTLWHRERGDRPGEFYWETSWRYLRVPVLQALFHRLGDPEILESLNLVELFDWTANVLNRVVRSEFFERFEDSMAVQYFYEPFLDAFDPELRKEFGVWYTPPEVVRYMVERVDRVLREELDCADGLASPEVMVLDPCCGTGAYLVAVIEKIAETLSVQADSGAMGALGGMTEAGQSLKEVALSRVFGFELLTAPFVIAHLQIALKLQALGDPLVMDRQVINGQGRDRVGVFLTNALTGWTDPVDEKQLEFLDAFARERDAADRIKQKQRILVVLGNPPYNSFAGISTIEEERELSEAYRTVERVAKPQGQGLNDLYVRFFRAAERRIVEMSQRGIVCFISNYSWLDGLSFTGMRERYLTAFDRIYIDNLHGDKYATGKVTPDGRSDPSVFSTGLNKEGIQVGTAIGLLMKRAESKRKIAEVLYRDFRGKSKLQNLSGKTQRLQPYEMLTPSIELGLSFKMAPVIADYFEWPSVPDIIPNSFPGIKTSRDQFLVDIDLKNLEQRIADYLNPVIEDSELEACYPSIKSTRQFPARQIRSEIIKSHNANLETENKESSHHERMGIVKYAYRPFDVRYLFWEPHTKLLDRNRAEYKAHVFDHNFSIVSQQKPRRDWSVPQCISHIGCLDLMDRSASCFPLRLRIGMAKASSYIEDPRLIDQDTIWNLSDRAVIYSQSLRLLSEELGWIVLSINASLFSNRYQSESSGSLRQDWPRIPLPNDRNQLQHSAQLGQRLAHLLDPETPVETITRGAITPPYRAIAVPTTIHGGNLKPEEFQLTASWGHGGNGKPVMPGKGRVVQRDYTNAEREGMGEGAIALLGEKTNDIYLNDTAYWSNIPDRVWKYTIGGYQVLKKWLSYRSFKVLGRPLKPDEIRHVAETARRISAIILMEPDLDDNYQAIKQNTYPWPKD